jgi:predicted ester cyclase
VGEQDLAHALTDRSDRVANTITEGDKVWTRFNLRGANTQSFYGLPPTGRRCVISDVGIARSAGDDFADRWYLADGLGALLQLGALDLLEKLGCKPV